MSAAANRDVILVQYSKRSLRRPRSPCGAHDRRTLASRARAHSTLAGAELARVRGPDPLFGRIERRVGARRLVGVRARESLLFFRSSGAANRCISFETLPHRSAVIPAYPGSSRMPEPCRLPRSPRGDRGGASALPPLCARARCVRARLATITLAPVRTPSVVEVARGLPVHLPVNPLGAEVRSAFMIRLCVHRLDRARPPCDVRARSLRCRFATFTPASRLVHLTVIGVPAFASASR